METKTHDNELSEIMKDANYIINSNLGEFYSMHVGRDPRLPEYNWISIEEVEYIHDLIIRKLGGKEGIHNRIDLEYAIKHPLTDIVGVEEKIIIERICECAYLLGRCFIDCGAQVSASVFLLLCKHNSINVDFKLGDIYDIFSKTIGPSISYDEFRKILLSHIVCIPKQAC